ncbi:gamma-glutamyl-gamma-aminobutyrate hydrolase family protein [Nitrosopumilus sp.]|uniref:gamma-glutamyl-gamma-aminobutyrate hydrolase family protein n=1 Tax=Nitrosopumilus sp. TaxID=2024843 RepID=UPI003D131E77
MSKRIGLSLRIQNIEKFNEKRDSISHDWIYFLQSLDFLPILIPNTLQNVESYLSQLDLDAVVLSGGDNIGEFPERDETENKILEYSMKNSIPVLGVCRGMQLINTYFNGKISKNNNSSHVGKNHEILITNSNFENILKHNKLQVNSFHNNLIKKTDIAKDLEIFALSENDSTIEGYFHKKFPIIGVMWHPERDRESKHQLHIIDIICNKIPWKKN